MSKRDNNYQEYTASFVKGLEVIKAFDREHTSITATQMAEVTGFNRATARRFLLTLESLGYVKKERNTFVLTPKVLELGFSYFASISWTDLAQDYMKPVVKDIKLSCSIGILDQDSIVVIARVAVTRVMSEAIHVGSRLPAAYTVPGRIYMAHMEDDKLKKYIDTLTLKPHTAKSITSKIVLYNTIKKQRRKAYSLIQEEIEEGFLAIGVPIYNRQEELMAVLNVVTHKSYKDVKYLEKVVLPKLQTCADEISMCMV